MDNLVLKLTSGKEVLAELSLEPQPGPTLMSVNYLCILDSDKESAITLAAVPKRADPLQVATDALHLLGYPHSGRKALKKNAEPKRGKVAPVMTPM